MKSKLNRTDRLRIAAEWITNYEGKNLLRGYKKKFGVNLECAIQELQMLGVELEPNYIRQVRESEKANIEKKRAKKELRKREPKTEPMSDDVYCFIAGYTSNGFAYGITWEEVEEKESSCYQMTPIRAVHF